jgi:NADP-dependent 3-hydroxy acid dehydrogenase YdfG
LAYKKKKNLTGKVVLITGANSGLGKNKNVELNQ